MLTDTYLQYRQTPLYNKSSLVRTNTKLLPLTYLVGITRALHRVDQIRKSTDSVLSIYEHVWFCLTHTCTTVVDDACTSTIIVLDSASAHWTVWLYNNISPPDWWMPRRSRCVQKVERLNRPTDTAMELEITPTTVILLLCVHIQD